VPLATIRSPTVTIASAAGPPKVMILRAQNSKLGCSSIGRLTLPGRPSQNSDNEQDFERWLRQNLGTIHPYTRRSEQHLRYRRREDTPLLLRFAGFTEMFRTPSDSAEPRRIAAQRGHSGCRDARTRTAGWRGVDTLMQEVPE
jgi:hypothetical protein